MNVQGSAEPASPHAPLRTEPTAAPEVPAMAHAPSMPEAASMPETPLMSRATSGPVRSVAVGLFVLVAILIAAGGTDAVTAPSGATGDTAAALSVASADLAGAAHDADGVRGATGSYVPGVGIVVTTEISQLPADELGDWARARVAEVGRIDGLPAGEEVIFLLDVARPVRTSRLISLRPSDLDPTGQMAGREAPATSTAPLVPEFQQTPERLASTESTATTRDE